ncbi:MbeD family mobilization/exclusion protein [Escherichia coli]|uniref:MbeD family mobilization/exclusion protein n=1 Tax=Escherichia coli TaxID=562 RepID=UPI003B434BD2
MTELEKQLLSVLEQLQQDYSKRLDEWESAFAEWRTHVWSYATGERGAERARVGLEHAGAEFERAAAPVVRAN